MLNVERNDDNVSENSNLEIISPVDVVRTIGEKQFWKARTIISNQQRSFTFQLFELHKLIKVQKSISVSTNLLGDEIHKRKGSDLSKAIKVPFVKLKPKDTCQKSQYSSTKFGNDRVDNKASKRLRSQRSNGVFRSELPVSPTQTHVATYGLPSPLSATKGLVYKPYAGQVARFIDSVCTTQRIEIVATELKDNHLRDFQHQISSCRVEKFQASKKNEVEENPKANMLLPLFPATSTAKESDHQNGQTYNKNRTRAIKVVPHSPRSTVLSAARIFQKIKYGRHQLII